MANAKLLPGVSHAAAGYRRAPSMGLIGYVTFGFNETANLDEGAIWPIAFAVKELTPEAEARIGELVKKAVR